MTTNLNIQKVIDFADKLGYLVEKEYCIGRECLFLELRSRIYKKPFLLHIPEKYSILHSDRQDKVVKLKNQRKKKSSLENVQVQEEDDFIKLLVDQRVMSTDEMTNEEIDVMKKYISKIDRFKDCLKSVNYSLAYLSPEGICYLNSKRNYECFIYLLTQTSEYGRLLLVSSLPVFYSKKINLENDLMEMFRGIHEISHRLRNEQVKKLFQVHNVLNQEFEKLLFKVKTYQERNDRKIEKLTSNSHKIQEAKENLAKRRKKTESIKKPKGIVNTLHSNLDQILELDSISKEEQRIRQVDLSLASEVEKYNDDTYTLWEISEQLILDYSDQILELKEIILKYRKEIANETLCLSE